MSNQENKLSNEKEIDLLELCYRIWDSRKIIYKSVLFFIIIGVLVAFGTPKEYKSEATLLIEAPNSSSMNGLLQQFGGLAGINLGAGKDESTINPELFPVIIQSTPFLTEILNQKISYSKADTAISVFSFLNNHIPPSLIRRIANLPGKFISIFKHEKPNLDNVPETGNYPIIITLKQAEILNSLKSRIIFSYDDKSGKVVIGAKMPEALAAAQLNNYVLQCLTKYLIDYKIQKAQNNLNFLIKQTEDSKIRFVEAQQRLANFRDANINIISTRFKSEEELLQNEYTLTYNVYNGLSQQLEQSKIKVQEKIPTLKVINPAIVPLHKSEPKRLIILIIFLFLGITIGISYIFLKHAIKSNKR